MVPNYYLIQNEHLRSLVIASETIHSLPAEEIVAMVDRISKLPPEGAFDLIRVLEEEQGQIEAIKKSKGITSEMELKNIEEQQQKLVKIKKNFDNDVRNLREESAQQEDDQNADALLQNL